MDIKNGMLVKVVYLPIWKQDWSEFLGQQGIVFDVDKEEKIFKINFGYDTVSWWEEDNVEVVDDSLAKALDAALASAIKYNESLYPALKIFEDKEEEEDEDEDEAGWIMFEPGKYLYDQAAANP